jgi:hypothetical protein
LVALWKVLTDLSNKNGSLRFHHCRAKNVAKLVNEVEIVKELAKPMAEFVEYESRRTALCKELCEYEGNPPAPSILNGSYQFTDQNKVIVEERIKDLQKEFSEVIAGDQKRQAEFVEFLNEEIDVDLLKIKMDLIPQDLTLTGFEADALSAIIED